MADDRLVSLLRSGAFGLHERPEEYAGVELDLRGAELRGVDLVHCDLRGAHLTSAQLQDALLMECNLSGAHLDGAALMGAELRYANFANADMRGVKINDARAPYADFSGARMQDAYLWGSDLREAIFRGADLTSADLRCAQLVRTDFSGATMRGCSVYGVSAWEVIVDESTIQQDLVITPRGEPAVTVDDLKVAQFIHLLLHNPNVRDVVDTVTSKVVLILGRFSDERKAVLDALRERIRHRNLSPVVFDFAIPHHRSMTDTVRLLAGMARFVVADISDPSTLPYELGGFVDRFAVPVRPIIVSGQQPPHGFNDLRTRYHWLLEPYVYDDLETLLANLDAAVIAPAEAKRIALQQST